MEIYFDPVPKCDSPDLENANLLSNKTYPLYTIEVKCAEGFIPQDRRRYMSVVCEYNELTMEFEWNKENSPKCIKNGCTPHFDFQWITNFDRNSTYEISEVVNYTCPNGYRMRIRCLIDEANGFGKWNFDGKCTGNKFSQ